MKLASFFAGEGGFDLAAEWMGWTPVLHCEINPFCRRILNYYWPNAYSYEDIRKTDFTIHRGTIDILTGGFPCQPYSVAGKRLGKKDDRHLWPEMLRGIREIQPPWVVGENVRGLINWNRGLVFDEVQADLEAIGYEVTPFILPACAINAPHRRDRIWFVAFNAEFAAYGRNNTGTSKGDGLGVGGDILQETGREQGANNTEPPNKTGVASDTNFLGQPGSGWPINASYSTQGADWKKYRTFNALGWENEPPVCGNDDGLPTNLDGIAFSEWVKQSIQAHGNAIVPQIAYIIFKTIQAYEDMQRM